jgi:hypothetical protein
MRLWSIHPKYLDAKGLIACWREGLGAKAALEKRVQGYKNHPQLNRFKKTKNQISQINAYLYFILQEAQLRNYNFDASKINYGQTTLAIDMNVTSGQVNFEFNHLMSKLKTRDNNKYKRLCSIDKIETHPLFKIVPGEIESWEKL